MLGLQAVAIGLGTNPPRDLKPHVLIGKEKQLGYPWIMQTWLGHPLPLRGQEPAAPGLAPASPNRLLGQAEADDLHAQLLLSHVSSVMDQRQLLEELFEKHTRIDA